MSEETTPVAQKATNLSGWKKAANHTVLVPSNQYVTLKIPDLPKMIESGQIPQHLLDAALGAAGSADTPPTKEMIVQEREFTDCMVMLSVVEPKITEADLTDIPFEDKVFIAEIATRRRDLDAAYQHIAGLHKIESWRKFREYGEFDPNVEGE